MTKRIMVTGGAGYIGSKFIKSLMNNNFEITVIDDLSAGSKANLQSNVRFYQESILSKNIKTILKKEMPDIIFHLAAKKNINESLNDSNSFSQVNIIGSLNIIEAAKELGIKRIIFPSTAGVYGEPIGKRPQSEDSIENPSSPYACSKLAIEKYLHYYNQSEGMETTVLRFANVYGPGGKTEYNSFIHIAINNMLQGQGVEVYGDGNQTRDFVFIDDIVSIFNHLIKTDYKRTSNLDIFNISTGKNLSINQVLVKIESKLQIKPNLKYREDIFSGQHDSLLDTKRTKEILGWNATVAFEEGLLKTIEYYKKESLYEQKSK